MILCITANPAIDVIYEMDELDTNGVNVVDDAYKTPGGKRDKCVQSFRFVEGRFHGYRLYRRK